MNILSQMKRNDPCPCGSGKKYKKCCLFITRCLILLQITVGVSVVTNA